MNKEQKKGYAWLAVAYGFALLISYYVYGFLSHDLGLIKEVLIFNLVSTVTVFCFSYAFDNANFYTPYWSFQPIMTTFFLIVSAGDNGDMMRQLAVLSLVLLWGIPSIGRFLKNWKGLSFQNWRYNQLSEASGKWFVLVAFIGIMLLPTLIIFLACLPLFDAILITTPFNSVDIIALLIGLMGIIIQFVASHQLQNFIKKEVNQGIVINTGIWKYTRHPNYFGEVLFWIGLSLFGVATIGDIEWQHALGLIAIVLVINFIAIPMREKRLVEQNPDYYNIIKKRSKIIPWFPK